MLNNIKFICEVVSYEPIKSVKMTTNIYRSAHVEIDGGTKTVKCTFEMRPFENEYMAFVSALDDNKKKGTKDEFYGNILHGFGKTLPLEELKEKLNNYTNLEQVKTDFNA